MQNSSIPLAKSGAKIDPLPRAEGSINLDLQLDELYAEMSAPEILNRSIRHDFCGKIALVSSFGAESVVLLHMVAQIDRKMPILFSETGMLFAETITYQREVADSLGLSNVQLIRPEQSDLLTHDADGTLHQQNPNTCCALRKVAPINRALQPYSAWITGRKRHQSPTRTAMPFAEYDDENRIKLNPLAEWKPEDVRSYMKRHNLPVHPLVSKGYRSIGCSPCTSPVREGEDPRAGRWRGQEKTECGIHFVNGKLIRSSAQ